MKTKSNFEISWAMWTDGGDYPNSLAGGPLPSHSYPEEVTGEFTVELSEDDDHIGLDELQDLAQQECPATVKKWFIEFRPGNIVALSVEEFDADSVREYGTED